jgi:hypothetical protein
VAVSFIGEDPGKTTHLPHVIDIVYHPKLQKGCTRLAAASDNVSQLLVHGRWFSLGTPASSTTKTGRHDIAKNIAKVALNTINEVKSLEPSNIKMDIFPVSLKRYLICFSNKYFISNVPPQIFSYVLKHEKP